MAATPMYLTDEVSYDELGSEIRMLRRVTRENRQLWYRLKVIQEPQHARACGAGTKANSDRRPVDPPPVVELRIKEGVSFEEGKEITFDYNASFFLYASLEQARKIAPGRSQLQPNPPILTGVPASGMAYLDRPVAAGYFIFPDLSVRHEGQYKLSFSLFETTKEEKDFDPKPIDGELPSGVDWRMEIKTKAFDVFSAKKFPGLLRSTSLSQAVAEQGCRVRIRREVRMRKRDTKGGRDRRPHDGPRHRDVTPAHDDPQPLRARSVSNASDQRTPYMEPQHRYPRPESFQAQPLGPPPPVAARPAYEQPSRGHPSFGDAHARPLYEPPRHEQPRHEQQPATHAPSLPPTGSYGSQGYGRHDSMSYGYSVPERKPDYHERHLSNPHIPKPQAVYGSSDGAYGRRDSYGSYPHTPVTMQPSYPQQHSSQQGAAPLKIHDLLAKNDMPDLPPIEPDDGPSCFMGGPTLLGTGSKRKHEHVFAQHAQSLHNGQRQMDPHHHHQYQPGVHRLLQPDMDRATYARADGSQGSIPFPHFHRGMPME